MAGQKVACLKCKAVILGATAVKNRGLCGQCVKTSLEDISDGLDIGMRLLRGLFFSVIFAGLGYGIGSVFGAMIGIFVAVPCVLLGFAYGCLSSEINSVVRAVLSFAFDR